MKENEAPRRPAARGLSWRWRRARRHWIFFTGLQFLWIHFLLRQPVDAQKVDVPAADFNAFLKPYRDNGSKPTYSQIQQWVEKYGQGNTNLSITQDLYPRLFPFCVTYEQIMNPTLVSQDSAQSKIFAFQHIFRLIKTQHDVYDKFYNYDVSKHSITKDKSFISKVELSRINPPEPDMINLRQWAHIKITAAKALKGIYVQSIVGPIGLPMGDFNLDFGCSDIFGAHDMLTVGELVHCHYRPRANIYHPRVYVGLYSGTGTGKTEWHVNFQWTDITCMETPYMQFLIIAAENVHVQNPKFGEHYAIVYSPVFLNTDFDSKDGSPYPYHPIWKDDMLCDQRSTNDIKDIFDRKDPKIVLDPAKQKKNGDSNFSPLKWTVSENITRIQPNEEYDACIRGTERQDILDAKDLIRLECPPGPFRCDKSYQQTAGGGGGTQTVEKERVRLVENEKVTSKCFPCAAPLCEELFSPQRCAGIPTEIIKYNDTVILESLNKVARSKSHGMLAILATLVFLPIANLMGRHYKEVCRNCLCGNGPWIFIHVIFHFVGAMILWLSVGPVVASVSDYHEVLVECKNVYTEPKEQDACATDRSIRNPHVPTGVLVFVMHNLLLIFGFFRSEHIMMRTVQLLLHSHLGYFTFVMAAISALFAVYNIECLEIIVLVVFLFVVPIVFHIISCVLDCMTDSKLGIRPRRRQYPILEPIRLEKRGPCEPCKWCTFVVFLMIMMILWFMVVLSANFSSKKDVDKFDPHIPAGSVSSSFDGPDAELKGVFGICGYVGGKKYD